MMQLEPWWNLPVCCFASVFPRVCATRAVEACCVIYLCFFYFNIHLLIAIQYINSAGVFHFRCNVFILRLFNKHFSFSKFLWVRTFGPPSSHQGILLAHQPTPLICLQFQNYTCVPQGYTVFCMSQTNYNEAVVFRQSVTVQMKLTLLGGVAPYSLVDCYRHFWGTCSLHLELRIENTLLP